MPRLSLAQMEARRRILDLSRRSLMPSELADGLCQALSLAIPADGFRFFALDPSSRLITRTLAASESDGVARREWLRDIYLSRQIQDIDFSNLVAAQIPILAYNEHLDDCWGLPERIRQIIPPDIHRYHYVETETPVGGVIFANFGDQKRWLASLHLYRRDAKPGFRRGDVAFIQLMAASIGQALSAALAREAATTAVSSGLETSGIWLLERDGRTRYRSPAAESWSTLLHDSGDRGVGNVPTPVWTAVASLRAGNVSPLRVVTAAGTVHVEASSGGENGSVAVVLTPQRPPKLPEIPDDWQLTSQESQVVKLLIQGLNNGEIAQRLSSSERTIESHLTHIYAKLDVHSRSEVIAQFFWRTYLPSLDREPSHFDDLSAHVHHSVG